MRNTRSWVIPTLALVAMLAIAGWAMAAKGGIPGPPSGEESPNNLSLPAVSTESAMSIEARWNPPEEPVLGVHYSWGCDEPEGNEQYSYPNTSCVDDLAIPTVYYNDVECTEAETSPCYGQEVSRIYWQKVDVNDWWTEEDGISPDSRSVAYVDWGDALEAVSWNEKSTIRVETQPYGTLIPGFDPVVFTCAEAATDPEADCKIGFQMWHVSGQGVNEQWGVRSTAGDVSYNYDSPFQIINTSNARLNLTKMAPESAVCPAPGEGEPGDPPPAVGDWDSLNHQWGGTCTWMDAPYSVEVSVGGKYVYGYNWRMRNVALEPCGADWQKTGYWRLTFYAPDDVVFDDALAPVSPPPAVPSEARDLPRTEFITSYTPSEEPGEDDALYKPVVDTVNNLTYIDICIVGKTQGGGGGGKGREK